MSILLSVIIPTLNPLNQLQDLLRAILDQDASSAEREIILVDNKTCPDQESFLKLASFLGATDNLRYFHEPVPGLHAGRHRGLHESSGEILTFIDDDIMPAPGWLDAIANTFNDPNVHLVGGPSLPLYEQAPPEWMEAFWTRTSDGKRSCGYLSLIDYGDKECEIEPTLVWGLNYSIRKKTLTDLGGFHPDGMPWKLRRYRGDGETAPSVEARRRGLKALYQPRACVYHKIPANRITVEYFERRAFLQGISDSFVELRQPPVNKSSDDKRNEIDWLLPLRILKTEFKKIFVPTSHDIFRDVKVRISQSYEAGMSFHQREVQNDPVLLEWVLRKNYLGENGRLPALR